jgi:hypothetical protein
MLHEGQGQKVICASAEIISNIPYYKRTKLQSKTLP